MCVDSLCFRLVTQGGRKLVSGFRRLLKSLSSLPRKVSVDIFRFNYRPRRKPKKIPVTTPVFGSKKQKNPGFLFCFQN